MLAGVASRRSKITVSLALFMGLWCGLFLIGCISCYYWVAPVGPIQVVVLMALGLTAEVGCFRCTALGALSGFQFP
jgi:hypothetical protein